MRWLTASCLLLVGLSGAVQGAEDRLAWWSAARFGMFIHWGVYSIPAQGEWIMHQRRIPIPEYEQYAAQFNPQRFDADAWATLAREAGQRYLVFTTKHHDGFCMFDSKLTAYDSMDTAAHRDFVRELVDACRRHDLRVGFYYSLLDWHHPEYAPGRPGGTGDFAKYLDYLFGQIRELLTNYGKIDILWFDGGWEHSAEEWRAEELLKMVRELQPDIVVNDRARLPADYSTPEQTIPDSALGARPWETCMTINDHWGYARDDHREKSVATLLQNLCDIASKGGNYLLNVGPTEQGEIPAASQERLRGMGAWLAQHGEAIYGTKASPFATAPPWGRITQRDNHLYLHVFSGAGEVLTLDRLKTEVQSARLLGSGAAIPYTEALGALVLRIPSVSEEQPVSVIDLTLAGPAEVDRSIHPDARGAFTLPARLATVHGVSARYESGDGRDNIGYWTDPGDTVSWDLTVERAGKYEVLLTYASAVPGAEFTIGTADSTVVGGIADTGGWKEWVTVPLGTIRLAGGLQTITVRPTKMPGFAVMNLRKIVLTPSE